MGIVSCPADVPMLSFPFILLQGSLQIVSLGIILKLFMDMCIGMEVINAVI